MSKANEARKQRANADYNSVKGFNEIRRTLKDTKSHISGRMSVSANDRIGQYQRNLTTCQSGKKRAERVYFAPDVYGHGRDMFVG